jgi:hypothetical protein
MEPYNEAHLIQLLPHKENKVDLLAHKKGHCKIGAYS